MKKKKRYYTTQLIEEFSKDLREFGDKMKEKYGNCDVAMLTVAYYVLPENPDIYVTQSNCIGEKDDICSGLYHEICEEEFVEDVVKETLNRVINGQDTKNGVLLDMEVKENENIN